MKIYDQHLHTEISPDSEAPLFDYCERALALGLAGFTVTDHCDVDGWDGKPYDMRRAEGYRDVLAAREKYPSLFIGFGAELGQEYLAPDFAREIYTEENLDFIIGSAHALGATYGGDIYAKDFYWIKHDSEAHCSEILDRYVETLISHCENSKFDVLGHLTYPLRYMRRDGFAATLSNHRDGVAAAFNALIRRGKGIEINSSGVKPPLGEPMPGLEWVKLFRDLGGEIITLGSDAHRVGDMAQNFDVAAEVAKAAGFTHYALYKNRVPEFVAL